MNTDEMYKVKRIVDKCLEVNRKGKAQVFFQLLSHVDEEIEETLDRYM